MYLLLSITVVFSAHIVGALPTTSLNEPNIDFFEEKLMPYFRASEIGKNELRDMFRILSNEIMGKERELNTKSLIIEKHLTEINQMKRDITFIKQHGSTEPPSGIQFLATVSRPIEDYALPSGTVTYNDVLIDVVKPNFNPTSGIFITPQDGVYLFSIDGFVYGTCKHGVIRFQINGKDSSHVIEQNTDGISSRGINAMRAFSLQIGDEISLNNDARDCVFGDELHPFTFMGTYFGDNTSTKYLNN